MRAEPGADSRASSATAISSCRRCSAATRSRLLHAEAERIYRSSRPEVVREKDGATARTAFAVHTFSEPFRRVAAHPRLVRPVEQLLGGQCYIHQFKINAKAAFDGDVWQWHQDYGTWSRDDQMPEPRAMNIALFLDDVTEFNGPLMFIPGSHRQGVYEAGHDVATTSYPLVDARPCDGAQARRARRAGRAQGAGGLGADVPLQPRARLARQHLAVRPLDRLRLACARSRNHIRQFKRPEWIAHRDFTPIEPLADDCLAELVAARAAAE